MQLGKQHVLRPDALEFDLHGLFDLQNQIGPFPHRRPLVGDVWEALTSPAQPEPRRRGRRHGMP